MTARDPEVDLLRCALPTETDPTLAERARKPFLKDACLEALRTARADFTRAGPVLARWFRKTKKLGSRDRPIVAEAVWGIIRHEHLLLRAGFHGDEFLHEGWCQMLEGNTFEHIQRATPPEDLSTAMSIPYDLAKEWLERLGPQASAQLAQAMNQRAPLTIRANTNRCTRDELQARLAEEKVTSEPCQMAPHGLHLLKRVNTQNLASFREGWFEIQDESSQLFVESVIAAVQGRSTNIEDLKASGSQKGELDPQTTILDVCAGSGGKSLALAAVGAQVTAFDIRDDVLIQLQKRAKRAGVSIALNEPKMSEVVIVDAPCSSTGRLRREPALRWRLSPSHFEVIQAQREILSEAANLVSPGGILAYATCSLLREENEPPDPHIRADIAEEENLESDTVPPANDGGPLQLIDAQMLWPHITGTDGFGWRIWRRPID